MKKYLVNITGTIDETFEVEAESEDEATDIAEDMLMEDPMASVYLRKVVEEYDD